MKTLLSLLLFSGLSWTLFAAQRQEVDFAGVKARAERHLAQGSFELALRTLRELEGQDFPAAERRWVDFHVADARWRSAAASENPDASELDAASQALRELAGAATRAEDEGELWAEIQESLGDFHWTRRSSANWHAGWPHYEQALGHWARSSDLARARERYLAIVFQLALPAWSRDQWGQGGYVGYFPVEVLENAVRIAEDPEDAARAHFLLGLRYAQQGGSATAEKRVRRELGAVLAAGRESEWYDDALYHLADYMQRYGKVERGPQGSTFQPDYASALLVYRRFLDEFEKGETRYWDDVRARIESITAPQLDLGVERFFLPESEIQYRLGWRNLAGVQLDLYPFDFTRHVGFDAGQSTSGWIYGIPLERLEPARSWKHATGDAGEHEPGSAALTLEEKLPLGAYVLRARGANRDVRALVLVSDAALTVKAAGSKCLAWFTDLRTGEPLGGARLRLQHGVHDGRWRWREERATTGADGTRLFELGDRHDGHGYFLAARLGERQAFVEGSSAGVLKPSEAWHVYAFTDRAAYRPDQTVRWKLVARVNDGEAYGTPSDATLAWDVRDPQGTLVREGESRLNAFGSAWGELETTAEQTLGEYTVRFFAKNGASKLHVGSATLFRLEEYKRPEFEVAVRVREDEDGGPRMHLVGDRVELDVEATYYFGAPVGEARVEVYVWQRPFYPAFPREREFPWFYDDPRQFQWWGGLGQQVHHQVLETDAAGRATIALETPPDAGTDLEYTIQARVVDASRREITGEGRVRVTRQEYFASLDVAHAIHAPGAEIELDVRTRDANQRPVAARGTIEVRRQTWSEPSRGYRDEVVARGAIATSADGRATWSFTPPADGYYQLAWRGDGGRGIEVTAATQVFVAGDATRELGYLPGGVEILVDRDTVLAGEEAVLMLATPQSPAWVLFTVESEELQHHEVVALQGTVKLVRLPIDARHVPNVQLAATRIAGGQAFEARQDLVVPPVREFLTVDVAHGQETYEPGQEGVLDVTVRDRDGEPVSAELALAVVDDSLAYIQADYAGDPRKFFYGQRRALRVTTRGTFHHGSFVRLARDEGGEVRDSAAWKEKDGAFYDDDRGQNEPKREGGMAGGGLRQRADKASAAPSVMAPGESAMDSIAFEAEEQGAGGASGSSVRVRSDFRETAVWLASVQTDAAGRASVRVPFPDSTTRWRTTVRVADARARFGIGEGQTRTVQPLIARLQAPRFFQVGDDLTLSGNFNNNTVAELAVRAQLTVEGLELLGALRDGALAGAGPVPVVLPAGGQARVDWRVRVLEPGSARLELVALGGEFADAVERVLPIHDHGVEAFVARAGKFDGEQLDFAVELPPRRAGSTAFEVQVTPSLAVTMLDALPYLVGYPYGCTEQTLSRFVPSAIVAKTLRERGLSPEDAMTRVFGGIDPGSAGATHPRGKQALAELDAMVARGLARLHDLQHAGGGWAWWKHGDSDPFMTAYVVWGLSLAREAGVEVRPGALESGARWLAVNVVEAETQPDLAAWMLHALAVFAGSSGHPKDEQLFAAAFEKLWEQRAALNAYTRALLALAAHHSGRSEQARVLARNLANGVLLDETPDTSAILGGPQRSQPYVLKTAHWGEDGVWNRWSDGGVEATAFALRALLAIDPESELIEPVTNWLVQNRRGSQWSNTRDTAICVLALNDYLRASGELDAAVDYEVLVNGQEVGRRSLSRDELLAAPATFAVDAALLVEGANRVTLRRTRGAAPLYFAARASFFSLEEPISARGNQVFVRRECYKLVGRPTLLEGLVYDRVPLRDGERVTSGERVEVVLTVEAKNHLEYMVFEDLKPAGFEAVQVRSGEPLSAFELRSDEVRARFESEEAERRRAGVDRGAFVQGAGPGTTGRTRWVHQELRDRKVALFLDKVPQGFWQVRYDLRAEVPGAFHALPVLGHAMYVPEIRCNGDELRVEVLDAR